MISLLAGNLHWRRVRIRLARQPALKSLCYMDFVSSWHRFFAAPNFGSGLAANESQVGLDSLAFTSSRRRKPIIRAFHDLADAMGEEPRGFHTAIEGLDYGIWRMGQRSHPWPTIQSALHAHVRADLH